MRERERNKEREKGREGEGEGEKGEEGMREMKGLGIYFSWDSPLLHQALQLSISLSHYRNSYIPIWEYMYCVSEAAGGSCACKFHTFPYTVIFGHFRQYPIFNMWVSPLLYQALQLLSLHLQIVLENYAYPGLLLIGTDSHTPNAGEERGSRGTVARVSASVCYRVCVSMCARVC